MDRSTEWLLRIVFGLVILFALWTGFMQVWMWAERTLIAVSQLSQQLQQCQRAGK